jgi:EamA domain-containing membrane protein RarD
MQFLAPSLQFATGVYYGEQLTLPRIVCFGCIWVAVILFSANAIGQQTKKAST